MSITILGDIGNKAFALPMVQAYPTDVNLQQLLAWDVTNQALNYVPYTGNSSGDFGVGRDLAVVRDAAVGRNATIAGTLGVVGVFSGASLVMTGDAQALTHSAVNGGSNAQLQATKLQIQTLDVVGTRKTGWVAMTGTPSRATKVVSTVTLPELAAIVMALQADLISHGLIGT